MPGDDFARPAHILLVEDNPGDVRLMREAFAELEVRTHLHVASNGESALAFIRRQGDYRHAPWPDLILLDLSLPGRDGRAVLAEIKSDPQLRRIPVVVLTSSQEQDDIARAYDLNVNSYIAKPRDLEEFIYVARGIEAFWLRVVKLPKE